MFLVNVNDEKKERRNPNYKKEVVVVHIAKKN